jgi:hypothetical protein
MGTVADVKLPGYSTGKPIGSIAERFKVRGDD